MARATWLAGSVLERAIRHQPQTIIFLQWAERVLLWTAHQSPPLRSLLHSDEMAIHLPNDPLKPLKNKVAQNLRTAPAGEDFGFVFQDNQQATVLRFDSLDEFEIDDN